MRRGDHCFCLNHLTAFEFSQSLRKHQVIPNLKKRRARSSQKYNIDQLGTVWAGRLTLNNLLSQRYLLKTNIIRVLELLLFALETKNRFCVRNVNAEKTRNKNKIDCLHSIELVKQRKNTLTTRRIEMSNVYNFGPLKHLTELWNHRSIDVVCGKQVARSLLKVIMLTNDWYDN